MAAAGAPPTYFNFDNFEEIQVATAGQDIKQQTGGIGINLVTRRGTNQFHGGFRGYFANDAMEAANVPAELRNLATPVTAETADHNKQISDFGGEFGGPIRMDRAWFYASYSAQDIRLVRRAGALVDRTQLKNPSVKVNWQADRKDMVSFLFFNGAKVKDYRSPGIPGVLFDAPTATFHQDNAYSDFPLHGLWKVADDRVINPHLFVSANYAYYNTGNALTPEGGMALQAGRSLTTGQSFGSFQNSISQRPQQSVSVDAHAFAKAFGVSHDIEAGTGFRTTDAWMSAEWPGNGILGLENSPSDFRAQVFRQGNGGNRANYFDLHVGDTMSKGRATVNVGLRYDHQNGSALPSVISASQAFPTLVPGLTFPGYESPFSWNTFSPRAGLTFALDETRRTIARAAYSRYAAQLSPTTIGGLNPASTAGSVTYRWVDTNKDHFAQADEVLTDQRLTQGGGFNPSNPTAVTSANQISADLEGAADAQLRRGRGSRADGPLRGAGELQLHANDRSLRQQLGEHHAPRRRHARGLLGGDRADRHVAGRRGLQRADVRRQRRQGRGGRRRLPDGDGARLLDGLPRPRGRAGQADVEPLDGPRRLLVQQRARALRQRRRTLRHERQPDADGRGTAGRRRPVRPVSSASSGSGNVYINAKWQLNANAMYQAPLGIEASANVFGRQGYPFPLFRTQQLGGESLGVHGHADDRLLPLRQRVGHGRSRRARVQAAGRVAAIGRRRLQPVQREHRAGAEQQHPVDDVQPDRAEPQPAHRPAGPGGQVLGF